MRLSVGGIWVPQDRYPKPYGAGSEGWRTAGTAAFRATITEEISNLTCRHGINASDAILADTILPRTAADGAFVLECNG